VDGEAEVGVDLFLIVGCAALEPAGVRIDKGPEHKGVAGVSRARIVPHLTTQRQAILSLHGAGQQTMDELALQRHVHYHEGVAIFIFGAVAVLVPLSRDGSLEGRERAPVMILRNHEIEVTAASYTNRMEAGRRSSTAILPSESS
jgi:hypothetical protein